MTVPPTPEAAPAVAVRGVRKAFGATLAVDDVSFAIGAGGVHALLGENGAGKSTLVKLMSGLMAPDAGAFRVFGEDVALASPRDAHRLGIQTAFQEMTLVRDLTVLDAMLMPYAPTGFGGVVRRRAAAREVAAHLAAIGLGDVDLGAEVRDLDLAQKQKIEIARALFRKPRVLLLDEPTSTLAGRDVDWLGRLIEAERARGATVVFISHRLREVRDFCDGLTVLRNGRHIATGRVAEFSDDDVIRMIVGRSIGQAFPDRPAAPPAGPEVLRGDGLAAGKLASVSFGLRQGEILGVAGLQGMGQLELFLACFGGAELAEGTIAVDSRPVALVSPVDAVNARIGISLVPEDRKTEALFLRLSGRANASMPVIGRFARWGLIDAAAETAAVRAAFARVEVEDRALWTRAGAFSGGNQQKIVLAKWLLAESRVLLLFDPTRGIDVGTKHELYGLMRAFADAGGSILFYSTEIPELVHLADRVLVLYKGRVVREVSGASQTEAAIVEAALGGASEAAA
jgi:ribose transport system ATP-binding protein